MTEPHATRDIPASFRWPPNHIPAPQEVDARCNDRWCAKKESYVVGAWCGNCGTWVDLRLTVGHEKPRYHQGPECPCCGCRVWGYVRPGATR